MDRVRPSVAVDEAFALQLFECPRNGLTRGSGHLAEQVVGQRKVEPDSVLRDPAVLTCQLDELEANPVQMMKARHVRNGCVLLAKSVAEPVQQRGCDLRVLQQPGSVCSSHTTKDAIRKRDQHLVVGGRQHDGARASVTRHGATLRTRNQRAQDHDAFHDDEQNRPVEGRKSFSGSSA